MCSCRILCGSWSGLLFKKRHEMALLQKRGSLGRHFPGAGLLPQQPATDRPRCSGISGSPGYGLCLCSGGILCRWTRSRSKRRHEMALLQKRGSLGATFREQASCPSNPQRTGPGVQEYRGARVMVFACVAAASYAAGRGRGPRGAMRWRCYKRGGAWGTIFREHFSCLSNPQRTGPGVQEYRESRVLFLPL